MYETKYHSKELSEFSFLVTGGAGFIGSNIVEYLLKHGAKKVRVLDNLSTGFLENIKPFIGKNNFEFIAGDICNPSDCNKATKNIDVVLHQAALGSVPRSIENPIGTNNANVSGFLNMLVAARDAKVKRFVYASSSSVYGDSKEMPKQEDVLGKPVSPYAVSKLVDELYADIFCKTYAMEIIGLRYFNIFGPRQNPKGAYAAAIPLFIDAVLNNKTVFINGDGNHTRDFTFVENAVQANIKAALCEYPKTLQQVYNIAVGDRISLNKLVELIQTQAELKAIIEYRDERPGDVRDSLANIDKAKKFINYLPEISFADGLTKTIEYFISKKW